MEVGPSQGAASAGEVLIGTCPSAELSQAAAAAHGGEGDARLGCVAVLAFWVFVATTAWLLTTFAHAREASAFEKPPTQFRAPAAISVQTVPGDSIGRLCRMLGEAPGRVECVSQGVVYLPEPCEWPDAYAQLVCHAKGHAEGWPADHSAIRAVTHTPPGGSYF